MRIQIFLILLSFVIAGNNLTGQNPGKNIVITGRVLDVYNTPVPGALIMVDGKNINKRTNNKGYFKVRVKPSAEMIGIFVHSSGIHEELINGRTQVNFTLKEYVGKQTNIITDPAGEEEINIGYGTVKKRNLTDQVSKIDVSEKQLGIYNNIYDMIKGQVAGVEVSGRSITIQGANSFMSSTEPLFVVDGMVVSSIDDISPQTVSSIEVLKGSAASIYGSRGANGVILINLKGSESNRK